MSKMETENQLSESEKRKFSVPEGGVWFHRQLDAQKNSVDTQGVLVAWDKDSSTGSKLYGVFSNINLLYENILSITNTQRCGYEIISQSLPCKLYLDVEWEGSQDSTHMRIRDIMSCMRSFCRYKLNIEHLEIYVSCSSRQKENGVFKNSYHVVVRNVMFSCNDDGNMKGFLSEFCCKHQDTYPVWYTKDNSQSACCIDMAVYTKNRCLRLPLCCKKGTSTAFVRINGDPLDKNDQFTSCYSEQNVDSWKPFIVTDYSRNDSSITWVESTSNPVRDYNSKKRVCVDINPDSTKKPKVDLSDTSLPVPISDIEKILRDKGDYVSKIVNVTYDSDSNGVFWQIQCNQRKKTRPCILDLKVIHKSNNCILFLRSCKHREPGIFTLDYHCTSTACRQRGSCRIHEFNLSEKMEMDCDYNSADEDYNALSDNEEEKIEKPGYEDVKRSFERNVFKIENPFSYGITSTSIIKGVYESDFSTLKHNELRQFYNDWVYYEPSEEDSNEYKSKKFIDKWLSDSSKRVVARVEVDPTNSRIGIYNLWDGYIGNRKRANLSFADRVFSNRTEAKLFAAGPIIRHFTEVFANGNQAHADYIMDWFANIVQFPHRRTEVAISLYGEQGTGKGLIVDWIRKSVLGPKHTFQTANPEKDLFARFSNGLVNKTLIQVDEVKSLHSYDDMLKDAITNRTVNLERKGKDIITVEAYANLFFTSNNEHALKVPVDDRRFVLFQCSSKYRGDKQYFEDLSRHLETPGVDVWFYRFLKERDISAYKSAAGFQARRPITEYYMESQRASIPQFFLYLSARINSDDVPEKVPAGVFFTEYIEWVRRQNMAPALNGTVFGKEIKKIDNEDGGIKTGRVIKGKEYYMDKIKLKEHLTMKNSYDGNVMFI